MWRIHPSVEWPSERDLRLPCEPAVKRSFQIGGIARGDGIRYR